MTVINSRYGQGTAELDMADQYYNMLEKVKPQMHIVDTAPAWAMRISAREPKVIPVRGAPTGPSSATGLPTPNSPARQCPRETRVYFRLIHGEGGGPYTEDRGALRGEIGGVGVPSNFVIPRDGFLAEGSRL